MKIEDPLRSATQGNWYEQLCYTELGRAPYSYWRKVELIARNVGLSKNTVMEIVRREAAG